jgi:lactoylglutathione lyase
MISPMPDRPPARLNLVVIRSADIERAAGFYRQIGVEFAHHAHGSGPMHYAAEAQGTVFEIYPMSPKSLPTTGTRIGFIIASLADVMPALAASGTAILTPPTDSEWGRRAVVKDPDGHVVELLEATRQ